MNFKEFALASSTVIFLAERYLASRQKKLSLQISNLKGVSEYLKVDAVKDLQLTDAEYSASRAYYLDKLTFGKIQAFFNFTVQMSILYFDGLAFIWSHCGAEGEILKSLQFVGYYTLLNMVLEQPFSLYSTFVLEEKHGFNKQTFMLYFTDLLKTTAITAVLCCVLVSIFIWIVQQTGDKFFVFLWLFMVVLQLVMIVLYPLVIQPLFNKVEPLKESKLKTQIEDLAMQLNFPLTKIFVIDGSKRSSHSNAYMYGLGSNKRIVLFDTLIEQLSESEILAVLCHEIGHWHFSHMIKMLFVVQLQLFVTFYGFNLVYSNPAMYESFGFQFVKSPVVAFVLYNLLLSPVDSLMTFLMHVMSRYNEYQADSYAKGRSKYLISGLLKLNKENKGALCNDPFFAAYHHSHPQVVDRIKRLKLIKSD